MDISGKVGVPEGSYMTLQKKEEDRLGGIDPGTTLGTQITNNINVGSGISSWIRANAAGTKLAGSSNLTVSRISEGTYQITASSAFASSGGFYQYGVVATPSTVSGNGGDGVSPFKAYSANVATQTGSYTDGAAFFRSVANDDIYLADSTDDLVYRHDLASFATAATTIDPTMNIDTGYNASCMSREGDYLFLAHGGPTDVFKAIKISDGSVLDFGNPGFDSFKVCAAATISSTMYIVVQASGPASVQTKIYTPNMGSVTLGSGTNVGSGLEITNTTSGIGCWDNNNNAWFFFTDGATDGIQVNAQAATYSTHAYPSTVPSSATNSAAPVYDKIRNCIYVGLTDNSFGDPRLYRFSGWIDGTNDTGTYTEMFRGYRVRAMWHDLATDILFISSGAGSTLGVYRYHLSSGTIIDFVSVKDTTSPNNPQVDYDLQNNQTNYYADGSGYVVGRSGSTNYLIKITYAGAPLDFSGAGASLITSVLTAMYEITSATQAYVYLFRSLSPIIRADGEFTAVVPS